MNEIKKKKFPPRFPMVIISLTVLTLLYFIALYDKPEINQIFNYPSNSDYALTLANMIPPTELGIVSFIASRHDGIFRFTQRMNAKSYRELLNEQKFFVVTLYVSTSILFLLYLINYYYFGIWYLSPKDILTDNTKILKSSIDSVFGIIVTFSFMPVYNIRLKRNLKLKIARICIKAIDVDTMPMADKMKYLVKCVETYNSFLNQKMHLHIKNLENFYSKIILASKQDIDIFIREFETELDKGDVYPAKKIASYAGVSNNDEFLSKRDLLRWVKDIIPILTPIISTGIAVFALLEHYK